MQNVICGVSVRPFPPRADSPAARPAQHIISPRSSEMYPRAVPSARGRKAQPSTMGDRKGSSCGGGRHVIVTSLLLFLISTSISGGHWCSISAQQVIVESTTPPRYQQHDHVATQDRGGRRQQVLEVLQDNEHGPVASPAEDSTPNTRSNIDYREQFPPPHEYYIGLLANPCGSNSTVPGLMLPKPHGYDCCMNHFGEGEYGHVKPEITSRYRSYVEYNVTLEGFARSFPLLARHDEILSNMDLVDEHGSPKRWDTSRRAEDEIHIDESCLGPRHPHKNCMARRMRGEVSNLVPPCHDGNGTVDATADCIDPRTPGGRLRRHCMQLGFVQTTYVYRCGGRYRNDDDCGTFVEVHRRNGSPYDDEDVNLGDTKILDRVTDGMVTTTIPLTYRGNSSRLLCNYVETKIRPGMMVRIKGDVAPGCCCPPRYSDIRRVGSFFCPRKTGTRHGPYADFVDTIAEEIAAEKMWSRSYPHCPYIPEDTGEDRLMCSVQSPYVTEFRFDQRLGPGEYGRYYSYPCSSVLPTTHHHPPPADRGGEDGNNDTATTTRPTTYTSTDLTGVDYHGVCRYGPAFRACAAAASAAPPTPGSSDEEGGTCHGNDSFWSFGGDEGKLVHVPQDDDPLGPHTVTFNDGRSTYEFYRHEFDVIIPNDNYELWYLQRLLTGGVKRRVVLKKKGFRVVWPPCTFDRVNDRYFPYAVLNDEGKLVETDAAA